MSNPLKYQSSVSENYNVKECGVQPVLYGDIDVSMDTFKKDLQKIVTRIVDRLDDLEIRMVKLEKSIPQEKE